MKLLRYIENSITKPGILDTDGGIRDASSLVSDLNGLTIVDELRKIKPTLFARYGNKIFGFLILLYIFLIFSFKKLRNE